MFKFLFLFLVSFNVFAADEWTTNQKYGEAFYLFLVAVDWGQTRDIAHNNYTECVNGTCTTHTQLDLNPLNGKHPSNSRIAQTMIGTSIAQFLIADALDSDWRSKWIAAGVSIEGVTVIRNHVHCDLRFNF